MKNYILILILTFVLTIFGTVTVVTPNGGEALTRGADYEITWTDDISEDVLIELYKDGAYLQDIISVTPSDSSYIWSIPSNIYGTTFQIRISSTVMPALHNDLSDGNFEILSGSIQVLSPNGSESFVRDSLVDITWTSSDIQENVKIELYDNETYLLEIVGSTANNGLYSWSVPIDLYGQEFKIRIASTIFDNVDDQSNIFFEIMLGEIIVNYPNGGEELERGSVLNITWDTVNIPDENVKITIYDDSVIYSIIANSTENSGSFDWTIPTNIFGSNFGVEVSSLEIPSLIDKSDNYFTIKKGLITIISPTGGETLEMFTDYNIQWTDDIPEDVTIGLYKNSSLITSFDVASIGSYLWKFHTRDLIAGNDYKLKLTSTLYTDIYVETGLFNIKGTNNVSGSVSGAWTEPNSPYIIVDSTYIETVNNLSIDAGVKIKSSDTYNYFEVYGTLLSLGEYSKKIAFEDVYISIDNNASSDTTKIKHNIFNDNNDFVLFDPKTFGDINSDNGKSVQQTVDGGYIITGQIDENILLLKTDLNGIEQWNKIFHRGNGESVQQTVDGGYIITGSPSGAAFLIKTDLNGNEQWTKTFYNTNAGHSVQQTNDGGYIVVGQNESLDLWIVKTNFRGEEEWSKNNSYFNSGFSIDQTTDGGFIITGRSSGLLLLKIDSDGVTQWDKTFSAVIGYSVQQTKDGGYIITGENTNKDILLLKTDLNGNEQWNKTFGGTGYEIGYSVRQTNDGGYIIAGLTESYAVGSLDAWLIKTDSNGNEEWNKIFGGSAYDNGYSAQQTKDGGYIITGYTASYGAGNGDAWLIKTDSKGNLEDNRTIEINNNAKIIIQNNEIQNFNSYGLTLNNSNPIISNNLISGNNGGIKFIDSSPQYIVNNTITDNDSIGIFFDSNSDAQLINNIVYGNGEFDVYINNDDSDPIFYYNDIQGGQAGFGLNTGVTYSGSYANNIDSDPLFDGDTYALSGGSPCLNSGYQGLTPEVLSALYIPQTDLLGNPRLFGEIDMGAYERQTVSIEDGNIVDELALYQNYPNPFNPETTIRYSLKEFSDVKLKIYNIMGAEVCSLVNQEQNKGLHEVRFNGNMLTSGIYFYRLSVNNKVIHCKKMMMLK